MTRLACARTNTRHGRSTPCPPCTRHGSTALQPRRRQTHHSGTFTAEPHPGLCSPREGGKGMRRAGRRQCRDIQRHDGGARSDRVTHTLSAHGTWSRAHRSARDQVPCLHAPTSTAQRAALPARSTTVPGAVAACALPPRRTATARLRDRRIPHRACDVAHPVAMGQLCFQFSTKTKKNVFFKDYPGEEWRRVDFTKNTAMRHRRVGGRAVTVTAMLHRQKDRKKKKTREICIYI